MNGDEMIENEGNTTNDEHENVEKTINDVITDVNNTNKDDTIGNVNSKNFENTNTIGEDNSINSELTDEFTNEARKKQVSRVTKVKGQGCSTFICGIIILVVIFCKIKGISFIDLTDKYIDYGTETRLSDLTIRIFPTEDSYTGILYTTSYAMIINCADNFYSDDVQNILSNYHKITEVFLVSDVTNYSSDINTDSVHASSEFSENYYCNGQYTEGVLNASGGKLYYLMENDNLDFHYVKSNGDTFRVEFSNGPSNRQSEVLINSENYDKSTLATVTYLANSGNNEDTNLQNYSEIIIDMVSGKVTVKKG